MWGWSTRLTETARAAKASSTNYVNTASTPVNIARPDVSTARPEVNTARPDVVLLDTLVKMKDNKAKEEPEPAKKMTRSGFDAAQAARDAEVARQLEVELHAEFQARIDVDHELAVILTHEEQEKYTMDEKAKILAKFFKRRKKQLAEERAAAIRNKPPTITQLRSLMMTYLKHTGRFKHSQLNKRTLEEIQALYIKEQERAANFVPIRSDEEEILIQNMNKKADGVHVEKVLEEPDSTKVEVKQEAAEHGAECIYYRIFRSDGSSRWIKTFSEMRFETTTPEGVDLVLWGDLRTMFEIHMLEERRYPLTKETLERMMSLKLIAEYASDSAYDLLRFIQKQIDEAGSHDEGKKDL
ncbi:hypothetical protein Tco_1274694 [Tanacetum coccineum]